MEARRFLGQSSALHGGASSVWAVAVGKCSRCGPRHLKYRVTLNLYMPLEISLVTLALQMRKYKVRWLSQHYIPGIILLDSNSLAVTCVSDPKPTAAV